MEKATNNNEETFEKLDGNLNEFSHQEIGIRLLYTVFFAIVFTIVKSIIQISVVFQFIHLFFAHKPNGTVRNFTNKANTYAFNILKYLTMGTNLRPFPFSESPEKLEAPK